MSFERAWWSFDLGKYRPCDGTYQRYAADSVPPLPALDGTFSWLAPDTTDVTDDDRRECRARVDALAGAVQKLGHRLPDSFARFMADPALYLAIPSCTACEFDLAADAAQSLVDKGSFFVRFLRDQQDCLFWSLIVGGPDDGAVLCSPIPFHRDAGDGGELDVDREVVLANAWIVAPSFEAFVWRYWMENEIWFALDRRPPHLTKTQQQYLAWYQPN